MSDPAGEEPARHDHTQAGLRRQMTELASAMAAAEDHLADTFEQAAGQRPPADAQRLRARAAQARKVAAKERDLAAGPDACGDDDRHARRRRE
jgi:hypothetical protein